MALRDQQWKCRATPWFEVQNGHVTGDQSTPESGRGIFSGFEHYSTPTEDDYAAVLTSGLVVLDTNTLLNLYRYTPQVRASLLAVLTKMSGQLWEPDQVMLEFWRRRESALRDYDSDAREFEEKVKSAKLQAVEAIHILAKRTGLDNDHKKTLIQPIEKAFDGLATAVESTMNPGSGLKVTRDTGRDAVLRQLEPIFRGRIGEPLDPEAYKIEAAEAERRIKAKIPPGYKDASKPEGHAIGDYLVWCQLIKEAEARSTDTLFVTGDVKEDWWREWGGIKAAGPRLELLDEFYARVGRRLFMLQPADFLAKAAKIFHVTVATESVAQARQIDRERGRFVPINSKYGYEAAKALARLSGGVNANAVEGGIANGDGAFDIELRRGRRRIAVVIFHDRDPVVRLNMITDMATRGLAGNYDGVLMISSRPATTQGRRYIRSQSFASFVEWTDEEDDDLLRAALADFFPNEAGNEERADMK